MQDQHARGPHNLPFAGPFKKSILADLLFEGHMLPAPGIDEYFNYYFSLMYFLFKLAKKSDICIEGFFLTFRTFLKQLSALVIKILNMLTNLL